MPEVTSLERLDDAPHAEVFDDQTPRTVRLELTEDQRVPEHRHSESNVVLYLLEGAVELTLGDEVYDLEPGDVARFDGDHDISPYAREASTALLVFAPKTDDSS
ncbi:cupin [Natrinema saccharevitans]|uniref:Cupin n=1 Tax=Natrinema saccharevitans TaxID=301967 RepID=A0A1S8AW05_9EURY|nr:cupin domain-containing protein [Natrinema saccharevitans]OLZ40960.1 cupin [Natrinema saccharevitans]